MPVQGAHSAAKSRSPSRRTRRSTGIRSGRRTAAVALLPLQPQRRDEPLEDPDRRGNRQALGPAEPRAPSRRARSEASRSPGTGATRVRGPRDDPRDRSARARCRGPARPASPEPSLRGSQEIADFDVSPDGKTLAFDSRGGAQDDLFLMPADGSGIRQLIDDAPKDRHPTFTPDGKRLVFISDRSGTLRGLDDRDRRQRPDRTDEDRQGHAHRADRSRPTAAASQSHTSASGVLFPMNDHGTAGPIEEIRGPADGVMFFPMAWSPDGRVALRLGRDAQGSRDGEPSRLRRRDQEAVRARPGLQDAGTGQPRIELRHPLRLSRCRRHPRHGPGGEDRPARAAAPGRRAPTPTSPAGTRRASSSAGPTTPTSGCAPRRRRSQR